MSNDNPNNSANGLAIQELPQEQTETPETTPKATRDALGRLLPGSVIGVGGARLASMSAWRRVLGEVFDAPRVRRILLKLADAAEDGESWAIQEALDRLMGKPTVSIDVSDTTDAQRYDERVARETLRITAVLVLGTGSNGALGLPPPPVLIVPSLLENAREKLRDCQSIVAEPPAATSAAFQDAPGDTQAPALDVAPAPEPVLTLAGIQALEAARQAAEAAVLAEADAWREYKIRRNQARQAAKKRALPRWACSEPGCSRLVLIEGGYCACHTNASPERRQAAWDRREAERQAKADKGKRKGKGTPVNPQQGRGVE